ncbi:uncharacterized protein FTOL_10724 [Fusarium torulosum]|uniref:Uncharacterized protein n=1 Tax=Fusarium torulosum TaxID=33205 RepID=A0AAE8MGU7_9HYPO|nr:uncharacterized protein FTOL_10724 [Fusarium torulosum]
MSFTQPSGFSLPSPMEHPCPGQGDRSFDISPMGIDPSSNRHVESIQSVDQGFISSEVYGTLQDSTASQQVQVLLQLYLRLEARIARLRRDNRKLKERVRLCEKHRYPRRTRNWAWAYPKRPSTAVNTAPEPSKESHGTPRSSSQVIPCTPREKPVADEDRIAQTDSEDEGN